MRRLLSTLLGLIVPLTVGACETEGDRTPAGALSFPPGCEPRDGAAVWMSSGPDGAASGATPDDAGSTTCRYPPNALDTSALGAACELLSGGRCPNPDDACVTYELIDPVVMGGRCVAPARACAIVTCSAGRRCFTLGSGQIVCQY